MASGTLLAQLRDSLERKTPSTGQSWRTYTSIARSVTGVSDGDVGERQFRALIEKLVTGLPEDALRALFLTYAGQNGRVTLSTFGRAVLAHGEQPLHSFIEASDARRKAAAEAHGWTAEQPYDPRFAHPWDRQAHTAAARLARQQSASVAAEAGETFSSPLQLESSQRPSGKVAGVPTSSAAASTQCLAVRPDHFASPTTAEVLSEHVVAALGTLRAHLSELADRELRSGSDPLNVEDRHSLHRGQRDAARQQLLLVAALEKAARSAPAAEAAHARGAPRRAWETSSSGSMPDGSAGQIEPRSLYAALRSIAAACGVGDNGAAASYCHPLVLRELWAVCAERTPITELPAGADARILNLVSFVYPPQAVLPPSVRDGVDLFAASAALHRRPPADPALRMPFGGGRMANGPFDRASGRARARYIPPPPASELPSSVSYRHCVTTLITPRDLTGEMVTRSARTPDHQLQLARVYGYNGASKWTRSANVFIVGTPADGAPLPATGAADTELAYSAAGTIVITNTATREQRFFRGHDDDVSCVARHPSGVKMVSGQGGRSGPFLKVWATGSMEELACCGYVQAKSQPRPGAVDDNLVRKPFYEFSISAASFEPAKGDLLAAVGVDEKFHELAIWDWQSGRLLGHTQTISADKPGTSAVHALAWAPRHAHAERVAAHVIVVVGAVPMPRFVFAEPGPIGGGQWLFRRVQGAQPDAAKQAAATGGRAGGGQPRTPRQGGGAATGASVGGGARVAGREQLCVAFGPARSLFEGLTVTGSDDGSLYAWDLRLLPATRTPHSAGAEPKPLAPRCVGFVLGAHEAGSSVSALAGTAAGFVSGGADGFVHVWVLARPRGADGRVQLARAQTFSLGVDGSSLPLPRQAPLSAEEEERKLARRQLPGARAPPAVKAPRRQPIRSLDAQAAFVAREGGGEAGGAPSVAVARVLVGTVGGEIWSIEGEKAERLVAAHAKRVDAVAPHPTLPLFASGGWDGRVCVWNADAPEAPPHTWQLPVAVTSVCFGLAEGKWVCAGLKNGGVLTASMPRLQLLSEARAGDGTAAASAVACSPDGTLLAVAAARVVDVFRVGQHGEILGLVSRCRGSSSTLRTLDWLVRPAHLSEQPPPGAAGGVDGWCIVQASTAARELLFWHAHTGAKVSRAALRTPRLRAGGARHAPPF